MGAWGIGPFENDAALDWIGDLESDGVGAIDRALARTSGSDYADTDDASAAVAAAVIVAAGRGQYAADLPEEVAAWLQGHAREISVALIEQARGALRAVMTSELQELWAETDELDAWEQTIERINSGLAGQ